MGDELLIMKNMNLKQGDKIKIKGVVKPDAKGFSLNLGSGDENVVLHFNPRFDMLGDYRTIVCNSREGGTWCEEQRNTNFPFESEEEAEISVSLKEGCFEIKAQAEEMSFPNRMPAEKISMLSIQGDFIVKSFKIET
ncbi:16 kDa beta-galactoside-binding lectin-like [Protopterus annectens]|uniref:16 kDa beta-galactoside-binding lectin-like n=1 Tax=Protopterus annectens TaxID=7888 RepID=UPI001CFA1DFD|nr:16 kDa beta-galactoside-binding lectin-like [Protopterus annectens]XP_043944309.1 16 kDa beta-galactoside-binding lectin-like [Protopterus annectens]